MAAQPWPAARQNPPDVILMDILMPGMDGISTTRAILEQYPQVKIIMLTSYPKEDLVRKSLEAGAIGYIPQECFHRHHGKRHPLGLFWTAYPGARGDKGADPASKQAHQN